MNTAQLGRYHAGVRLPLVAAAVFLMACTPDRPAKEAGMKLRDTQTIHDPQAQRIWIVLDGPDGNERVIFCDQAMLKETAHLCVRWPGP